MSRVERTAVSRCAPMLQDVVAFTRSGRFLQHSTKLRVMQARDKGDHLERGGLTLAMVGGLHTRALAEANIFKVPQRWHRTSLCACQDTGI